MKLNLTYKEIIKMRDALKSVGNDKSNAKFSMKIAQNLYALKPHFESLEEAEKASDEMIEVDKKRQEIFGKYAVPNGENNEAKVPAEKWAEFKAEIEEFKNDNKAITDAYEAQMKSFNELLKTQPEKDGKPVAVDMVEIPDSMLPKSLSGIQLEGIFPLIKF